jgi:hypothetical protein
MKALVRISLILIMVANGLLWPTRSAYACRCDGITPIEALQEAEVVFAGRVLDAPHTSSYYMNTKGWGWSERYKSLPATFKVSAVWKGPVQSRITVYSHMDCGHIFLAWEEYLVYAHEVEDSLHVTVCNGTAPLARAGQDLAYLGKGEVPLVKSALSWSMPLIAVLASLFLFSSLVGVRRVRKRLH